MINNFKKGDRVIVTHQYNINKGIISGKYSNVWLTPEGHFDAGILFNHFYYVDMDGVFTNLSSSKSNLDPTKTSYLISEINIKKDIQYYREERLKKILTRTNG